MSKQNRRRSIHVENLEGRQLLASATLSGSTLTLTGDVDRANTLNVEQSGSTGLLAKFNGQSKTFAKSAVTKIVVRGGQLADYVGINSGITIPANISTGSAPDTVWSGGGNDTIYGGSSGDQLNGRGGNDYIFGDDGNDTLDGGAGTDRYSAGTGTNKMYNFEGQSNTAPTTTTTGGTTTGGSTGSGTPVTGGNLPGTGSGGSPNAVITASGTSIYAGGSVFVNGVASTLNAGSPITARYEWNFGDNGSRYNTLVGFNAAHQYDRPGLYTITLRVTNEAGKSDISTRSVSVSNTGRRTIFVSGSGNDSNNGGSEGSAIRTVNRARQLAGGGSNVQVLFRRGDTFTFNSQWSFSGNNGMIGAYGSGDLPTILYNGSRQQRGILLLNGQNTIIRDVTFTTTFTDTDKDNMPDAMSIGGRNITVRGNEFLNIGTALNNNQNPTGVLAQDNTAPSDRGLRSYFSWVQGADHVYLGNSVANSTREAPLRIFQNTRRVLLHGNDFTNKSRQSLGDRYDTAKNSLTVQWGEYVYVANNRLSRGPVRFGPLGDGDGYAWKSARLNYAVAENNMLDAPTFIEHGAQHVMIRNNISIANATQAYTVDGYDGSYSRGVVDLHIINNTAVNKSSTGNFLSVGGSVNGISLVNNLYVAGSLQPGGYQAAPVYVMGSSLSSFRTISNNIWARGNPLDYAQGGMNYVWGNWSNAQGYRTPEEWNNMAQVGTDMFSHVSVDGRYAPGSDTIAASGGRLYGGVFTDYYGKVRSAGSWSVGAVEV